MRICFDVNGNMIALATFDFDPGIEHSWHDVPVDYDSSKVYKYENGSIVELLLTDYDPKRLRVYRSLPENMNPLISDFSILGFRKRAPHYDKGKKTKAEYHCATNDDIIVEKIFTDIRESSSNRLISLQVTFNWYCEDGSIGLSKTEIVKELNKAQAETIERQRRERSIDFLISEARGTVNEPYINMLMLHYETEINHYKSKAADDFAANLKSETDPTISAILSARVPFASDHSYTVPIKESILYQIGDLDEVGLIATLLPV